LIRTIDIKQCSFETGIRFEQFMEQIAKTSNHNILNVKYKNAKGELHIIQDQEELDNALSNMSDVCDFYVFEKPAMDTHSADESPPPLPPSPPTNVITESIRRPTVTQTSPDIARRPTLNQGLKSSVRRPTLSQALQEPVSKPSLGPIVPEGISVPRRALLGQIRSGVKLKAQLPTLNREPIRKYQRNPSNVFQDAIEKQLEARRKTMQFTVDTIEENNEEEDLTWLDD
jgi:hypothetical protein